MLNLSLVKIRQHQGYTMQDVRNVNKQVFKQLEGKYYDCKMQMCKPTARFITRQRETSSKPETKRWQTTTIS